MKSILEYLIGTKSIVEYIIEKKNEGLSVNGFFILKPEFLEHEYEFDEILLKNNYTVLQKVRKTLSKPEAEELYNMLKDKEFYDDLCTYMASDECICYLVHKDCKDVIKDMKRIKNKIRKDWGKDEMRNALHSSDSKENVEREYKLILQDKTNETI